MKILKRLVLTVVVLLIVVVTAAYSVSSYRFSQKVTFTDSTPIVTMDSASIAKGEYLVRAITKCADCHGQDLGGQMVIDDAALGRFYAPNLTSGLGSVTAALSDADVINEIRHGLAPDGRKLMFMPVRDWATMADADVAAIVAYLRSLPAVDRESQRSTVGPMGRALYVAGQLPLFESELITHDSIVRLRPETGVSVEYGRYLAQIGGCTGCHGPTLSGGKIPGTPPRLQTGGEPHAGRNRPLHGSRFLPCHARGQAPRRQRDRSVHAGERDQAHDRRRYARDLDVPPDGAAEGVWRAVGRQGRQGRQSGQARPSVGDSASDTGLSICVCFAYGTTFSNWSLPFST